MPAKQTIADAFLSWRNHLARVVSRIVPPHEIEDIVQETYVRACQFHSKGEIRSPGAFMTRIARNLALDYVKRAEWRLASPMDDEAEDWIAAQPGAMDAPFDSTASGEEFAHFCEAVRQLPVPCRRVFVLKKVYGHSQQEIAEQLNLSVNVVEKYVAQGLRHCVRYMHRRAGHSYDDRAPLHRNREAVE